MKSMSIDGVMQRAWRATHTAERRRYSHLNGARRRGSTYSGCFESSLPIPCPGLRGGGPKRYDEAAQRMAVEELIRPVRAGPD